MEGFSFTWTIKNFSMCKQTVGSCIESPIFVVDSLYKTEWCLRLYPRGKTEDTSIVCSLYRSNNEDEPKTVTTGFSIIIDATNSSLQKVAEVQSHTFTDCEKYLEVSKRKTIFENESVYLPNDTLTVRCKMPANEQNIIAQQYPGSTYCYLDFAEQLHKAATDDQQLFSPKLFTPNRCSGRTLIRVEQISITWHITQFSARQLQQKITIPVVSASSTTPTLFLTFYLDCNTESEENVQIEVTGYGSCFVRCNITVMDVKGMSHISARGEFMLNHVIKFPSFIKKSYLMAKQNLFLQDDVLALRFEFRISDGRTTSYISETHVACPDIKGRILRINKSCSLKKEMKHVYDARKFCDIAFEVENQIYPAHRAILANKSPAFLAMFESKMRKLDTAVTIIPDLDKHTMNQLLVYIYSGCLMEDLQWDSAKKLYFAADKYKITCLKDELHSFLVSNLSAENACDALLLADWHRDEDLQLSVENFMSSNALKIFLSDGWKSFLQSKPLKAAEIMQRICIQKFNCAEGNFF